MQPESLRSAAGEPDLSGIHSSAARQLLRFELGLWCDRAGVRHADVGARLGVSRASASQLIAGVNLPSKAALEVMLRFLGAEDRIPVLTEVLRIARDKGRKPDHSASYRRAVHDGDLAIGLEALSEAIDVFGVGPAVPVLRQGNAGTARLCWLLEERALPQIVADKTAARDQVGRLVDLASRSTVSVRVVPARAEVDVWRTGGFRIFHSVAWTVAYQETLTTAHYFTDPSSLGAYTRAIDSLKRVALPEDKSRTLLARLAPDV
jgi:transcriptional regulator with XRE-family HTH domain